MLLTGDCENELQCKPMEDCPEFLEKQKTLRTLANPSPERAELVANMRELVCNAKQKGVCCRANYEIVGGTVVTDPNLFPYLARIVIKTSPFSTAFCGAALIHFNLLITAKHCVERYFWKNCIDERDCYAIFRDLVPGRTNHEKSQFTVPIVEVFLKEGRSDLAVLKLAYPVNLKSSSQFTRSCDRSMRTKTTTRALPSSTSTWAPLSRFKGI